MPKNGQPIEHQAEGRRERLKNTPRTPPRTPQFHPSYYKERARARTRTLAGGILLSHGVPYPIIHPLQCYYREGVAVPKVITNDIQCNNLYYRATSGLLTVENYVKYSFEMLNYSKRSLLFNPDWPIYTTSHNTPPALYGENAVVSNCFIANGSIIKGTVKNSVISRDVVIEEGAVVENCILFTKTKVGKDAVVRNVVTDKQAKIITSKNVCGDPDNMMFVDFGEII